MEIIHQPFSFIVATFKPALKVALEHYSVDSSSPAISASTTTVTYVYAGSMRVASLTTQATTTGTEINTFYYHGDHLGSSSIITDGSGTVVRNISYQPWGNKQENTKPDNIDTVYDPKHKFTGQILDDSTNLYYYGARYYDPTLRRFISPDPVVQDLYDLQSLNKYVYCRNNPLILIDPSGCSWLSKWWRDSGNAKWWNENRYYVWTAAAIIATGGTMGWTSSTLYGELWGAGYGGFSAAQVGGDIGKGMLFGAVVGGATSYLAGNIPGYKGPVSGSINLTTKTVELGSDTVKMGVQLLAKATLRGLISGAGYGAIAAYGGGKGSSEDIWRGVYKSALTQGAISFGFAGISLGGSDWQLKGDLNAKVNLHPQIESKGIFGFPEIKGVTGEINISSLDLYGGLGGGDVPFTRMSELSMTNTSINMGYETGSNILNFSGNANVNLSADMSIFLKGMVGIK